ncbi:hypothetical protein [Actibacterium sp. MT2.3-13A]|uniref:hypothetical protein n=1 Tax=Actibacterium sp. MT2.3-13A TaxID=2828332 RepID=UPI001BA735D7|nr:hypothetical protein [Actibacterium sp. MT2.3-13A]
MQRLLNIVSALLMLAVVLYAFGIFGYAIYQGLQPDEPVAQATEDAAAVAEETAAAAPAAEEAGAPAPAPAAQPEAVPAPAAEESAAAAPAAETPAPAEAAAPAPAAQPDPAVEAAVARLVASRPATSLAGLPAALQPESFDGEAVLAMIAASDLADTVKSSLSASVRNAATNPDMVQAVALQVKEALGLKAQAPALVPAAPAIDISGLPAALQPESFDAGAVLRMIAEADLPGTVKSSLSAAVENARTNPGMVRGVVLQVKEALGL